MDLCLKEHLAGGVGVAAEDEMEAHPFLVRLWVAHKVIVLEQNNRLFHL